MSTTSIVDDETIVDTGSNDGFTTAQCEQLTKMIQSSIKSLGSLNTSHLSGMIHSVSTHSSVYSVQNSSNITWILDSGATDYIVPMLIHMFMPNL